jgi:hypothetical protein
VTVANGKDTSNNLDGMTRSEQARLLKLVENPPKGSKIEAAKNFGIDLTLNLRSLRLSPTERVREMEEALSFAERLREGVNRITA